MKVLLTTVAVRRAKLQSNHHQQTNTQFFYRADALPVTQPTVSKHWREMSCGQLLTIILSLTQQRSRWTVRFKTDRQVQQQQTSMSKN